MPATAVICLFYLGLELGLRPAVGCTLVSSEFPPARHQPRPSQAAHLDHGSTPRTRRQSGRARCSRPEPVRLSSSHSTQRGAQEAGLRYQSIQQVSRLHLLTIKLGPAIGGRKSPAGHTELSSPVHRTTAVKGPHLRGRAWRAQQQDGVPSHRHIRPVGQRRQCFTCSPTR